MDITYRPNKGGPDFGYDATVTHPIVANMTHKQAATVGRATEQAEKRKILKYGNICSISNIAFVPTVYEVGGRSGELWTKEFKRLCGMHSAGGHHSFRQYWSMRISVALQTGMANAILVRKGELLNKIKKRQSGGFPPDDIAVMLDSTYSNIDGFNFNNSD